MQTFVKKSGEKSSSGETPIDLGWADSILHSPQMKVFFLSPLGPHFVT